MIEQYEDILNEWAVGNSPTATVPVSNVDDAPQEWSTPCQDACTNMMEIIPSDDFTRWAVQRVVTVLANADYYYTKDEVDRLLQDITASGVTRAEVEEMIARAVATKADKAEVDAIAAQVATNTERILNTYTKPEVNNLLASYYTKLQTNSMFGNYSKVEDTTLILNAENIN